jgi:hypothetical protein
MDGRVICPWSPLGGRATDPAERPFSVALFNEISETDRDPVCLRKLARNGTFPRDYGTALPFQAADHPGDFHSPECSAVVIIELITVSMIMSL